MSRVSLVLSVALGLGVFGGLVAAEAAADEVRRIGYLSAPTLSPANIDDFRRGLHEHGYVEGQNLFIEWRSAEGNVLANPDFKPTSNMLAQMRLASQPLAVQLHVLEAREPQEISAAFAHMSSVRADALVVLPDPWFLSQRTRIAELAMSARIPAMYHLRQYLEVGGLMAYGPTYVESFQQSAGLVDKIVRGARPADLPVEQPWRYEVVINLKTAKALGLTIPQSIFVRADEFIE